MSNEPEEPKKALLTHIPPDGVAPANGYSHVVVGEGRLVVVSGQVALDEQGNVVGEGDAAVSRTDSTT